MKQILFFVLLISFLVSAIGCSAKETSNQEQARTFPSDGERVEIIYLGHPPVKKVVNEVVETVRKYRIEPVLYDFDSAEGEDFAKEKKITDHVPFVIYINGKNEFVINDKRVIFFSFPAGMGDMFPVESGSWTMEDLDAVLKEGEI